MPIDPTDFNKFADRVRVMVRVGVAADSEELNYFLVLSPEVDNAAGDPNVCSIQKIKTPRAFKI